MDISKSEERERKLARELSRVFGISYDDVIRLLGFPPDISRLTEEMFAQQVGSIEAVLFPYLSSEFFDNFNDTTVDFGFTFEETEVDEDATNFINRYGFNLVKGLDDRSRELIRGAVDMYFRNAGLNTDDIGAELYKQLQDNLAADILKAYSPARAATIARTEITRAAAEAENAAIDKLMEESGVDLVKFWITTNEPERNCIICGARHGLELQPEWGLPPAHPRCGCRIISLVRRDDGNYEDVFPNG